jgi:hypothetical protein
MNPARPRFPRPPQGFSPPKPGSRIKWTPGLYFYLAADGVYAAGPGYKTPYERISRGLDDYTWPENPRSVRDLREEGR